MTEPCLSDSNIPGTDVVPVSTSTNSPDTLPAKGYTEDQLSNYIYRELGSTVFEVEITKQQVLDCIAEAVQTFSMWRPRLLYQALQLTQGVFQYLKGVDLGMGVVDVWFVEPNPVPTELFYGNLIDPAPLFRTGLDEYDTFLRWRKIWMRVTSVQPDWMWDDDRGCLWIHNPIERYQCAILAHGIYPSTKTLSFFGAQWVRDYAREKARFLYADTMMKYSGAIPGPVQNLQFDGSKRDNAQGKVDKLLQTLKDSQETTPISLD